MKVFPSIFLSILFFIPLLLRGQEYVASVRSYSEKDGMSNREVKAIFQDSRGLIWLGTSAGLDRFDAYDFKRYDQKSCGLGLSDIHSITEDGEGWLWIAGSGSSSQSWLLQPYLRKAMSFETRFATDAPCKPEDIQNGFYGALDGSVWFALKTRPALVRYQPNQGWKVFELPHYKQIALIGLSASNTVWCTVNGTEILEFDTQIQPLRNFKNPGPVGIKSKERFFKNGFYYTVSVAGGTKKHLYYINAAGERSSIPEQFFAFSNGNFPDAMCAFGNSGLIWANNQLIHPLRGGLIDLSSQIPHYFNFGLRAFLEDSEGRFWVGGEFGVVQVEIQKNQFDHYFSDKQNTGPSTACRGIALIDNQLYVQLERKGLQVLDLSKEGSSRPVWPNTFFTGSFGLFRDRKGQLYAGFAKEIRRYDPKAQQTKIWVLPEKVDVWSFYEHTDGKIWVGTGHGLFFLEGEAILGVDKIYRPGSELSSAHIFHMAPDFDGNIWLCTNKGMFRFSTNLDTLSRFWSGGKGGEYLPADVYHHFLLDDKGSLWLASAEKGLIQWRPPHSMKLQASSSQDVIRVWDKTNGLPSDLVYAVYADQHQNLWASTDAGIIRLDPKRQRIQAWIEENGILNKEFNRVSHLKGADGKLYFGGLNGVVAFDPIDLSDFDGEGAPSFQVIDFYQFNVRERRMVDKTGELFLSNKITLSSATPMCQLNFSLLDFEYMEEVLYAYQLEGLDSAWHYQVEHNLTLGDLPPGEYRLNLKGRTSTGEWSSVLSFLLQVKPPLWVRAIKLGGLVLVLGLVIWRTIEWYNRRRKLLSTNQGPLEVEGSNLVEPILEIDKHKDWLKLLEETARANIGDYDFSLDTLAATMGMSDRHLRRKLKEATGLTSSEYLREIRLQKAMQLLESGTVTSVSELALSVGMRDVKYFSRHFKTRFGDLPSKYL